MLFKDIVGHDALKGRLAKTVVEERIPHAQLFWGPEGGGNLALALAFAQYANCENRADGDACGTCNSCNKAAKYIHPDIHFSFPTVGGKAISDHFADKWRLALLQNPYLNAYEWLQFIDAENKQGNITAAECNEIAGKLKLTAAEARYKIQIIWMAEYLGKESNKLLKIIEEPPPRTLFVLVVNNREAILPTILSRTQHVHVPRLPDAEIERYLRSRSQAGGGQVRQLTALAQGNLNMAMQLLRNDPDGSLPDLFNNWLRACLDADSVTQCRLTDDFQKLGRERQKALLRHALNFVRESLLLRSASRPYSSLNQAGLALAQSFSQGMGLARLGQVVELLENAIAHIGRNANPKILFLHLSVQITDICQNSASPA